MRDVDAADALHAFFAFLLAFEELALARDVAAVAFGENVFAQGANGFARDDVAADGGLNGDFELLARNQFAETRSEFAAALVGLFAMADERQRVDGLAGNQNVELDQIGFAITGEMVIERSVSARNAFQAVVEIENDFVERHFVSEHYARGREIFEILLHAALFFAELENGSDGIVRRNDHGGQNRFFDAGDLRGRRKFRGIVDFDDLFRRSRDAVANAGSGGDEVDAEFAFEALLSDFHVEKAKKSAAKTEAEGDGVFRFVEKRGVVQLKFAESVAKNLVVAGVHGIEAGEDHGLDGFEAGKWRGGTVGFDKRVSDARIGDAFDVGDDEADVAGGEFFERNGLGREDTKVFDFVDLIHSAETNFHTRDDVPFHDANENYGAAIGIEPRIENQGAQRRVGRAFGRRNSRDNGFKNVRDADAAFCADEQRIGSGDGKDVFDLFLYAVRFGSGKVNFIDDGNDGEIVARSEERVGDGLRFDALAGVDNEERAFARGKRARNFVGKINVAGSVDKVEAVFLSVARAVVEANAFGLDGDAALAFEVHRVEDLSGHFTFAERAGEFEKAVGQRRFAVVDVGDDAKIADESGIHKIKKQRGKDARRQSLSLSTQTLS